MGAKMLPLSRAAVTRSLTRLIKRLRLPNGRIPLSPLATIARNRLTVHYPIGPEWLRFGGCGFYSYCGLRFEFGVTDFAAPTRRGPVAAPPHFSSIRLKRYLARLRRDADKGQAALQFALIAPVFFLLLMGTIEAGVIFFAQSSLQDAVNGASRLIRTGQSACY